ncbi:NTE family protein [Fluviicoccus keumensis]|uniref:NTE family protein n=1 Tax=Fluviicoccus keumensis TaxID=1435465 RepID=A0A4Q7YP12_9GAMM|nr:patatin-like phospholipase family protein [Fluviicoccus keumensis]RZU38425.1 NTE family protein [Fluviicoccus keumensis]
MDSTPLPPHATRQQTARFRRILTGYFGQLEPGVLEEILAQCEWRECEGGDTLFRQGDPGDAAYFVISGRLRAIRTAPDGLRHVLGDIKPGETVGEIAVLSDDVRGATVLATRDSVVVRISTDRLQQWFMQYPQLLLQTAKLVIRRNRSQQVRRRRVDQVSNITILPLSPHIDLTRFRVELAHGMAACGKTVLLDPAIVDQELGSPGVAFVGKENPDRYRHLSAWLDKLESRNDYVVYLANPCDDAWTQRCLRQADRVLLLADAADSAMPPDFEKALMNGNDGGHRLQADTQLMLWHDPETLMPVGTARWLDARPWVREVIHVRRSTPRHMARLARLLTGNAVGLVLGSGGARGLAAVGIIRALEEAGIPVDRVGGTSIGAIMAAGVALDHPVERLADKVRHSFRQNPTHLNDLSPLPILSVFQGKRLNTLLQSVFPDHLHIEDLWINFYCISSDMATNGEVVHRRGSLWKAVRASAALPGIFPVVRLGDGLHVDGAFMNSLPVDVMADMAVKKILAVDFSWLPGSKPEFDDIPGPVDFLMDRFLNGRQRLYRVPTLLSSIVQSSLLASSQRSELARAEADVLFSPDLRRFELLGWNFFDALVKIGHEHAREVLARAEEKITPP